LMLDNNPAGIKTNWVHKTPVDLNLNTQVGGTHYTRMTIQPLEYVLANGIGFVEGCVIKYVSRWQHKGGVEDLKKARDFLNKLIAHHEPTP
jgi:hypothetical protein